MTGALPLNSGIGQTDQVKGRVAWAGTITVIKNEILTSLNKPEDSVLAIVEFLDSDLDGGREGSSGDAVASAQASGHRVHYVRQPFRREPDFGVTSVSCNLGELVARAEAPR